MIRKAVHITGFLWLVCGFASCNYDTGSMSGGDVLASINDKSITVQQFENAFNYYRRKSGYALEPNSKTKLDVLNNEFSKLVLAQVAQDKGYDLQDEIVHENKIIERQYLLDLYQKEVVENSVAISEKELRQLFVYANTRVKASHLFAPTLTEALQLKVRLQNGESFENLAKEVFKTSYLATSGGDVGEFGFDEMDIAFELAAFNAKVDSVVGPVKTAQGYSLIKVTSKFTKPLITENEFNGMRSNLAVIAKRRETELKKRFLLDAFVTNFQPDEKVVTNLWEKIHEGLQNNRENEYKRDVIMKVAGGTSGDFGVFDDIVISAADVVNELYYSPELTLDRIKNKAVFSNMILGLAYRVYQLKKVDNLGLVRKTDVNERIKYAQNMNLVKALLADLEDEINIPDFEIYAYYEANKSNLEKPLQMDFLKIVTDSKEKAVKALEELNSNKSNELAVLKKYTIDNESLLYNGRTGLKPIQEFGTIGLKLKLLNPGQISSVIDVSETEYHVYVCKERQNSRLLSIDEAWGQIERTLKEKTLAQEKTKLMAESSKLHDAKVFTEKIQTLALKLN
ncbi:hypothetical protein EP331_09215 [bacterium]|nr:MAG: hypothetical protein EP331_09215 [bacterium]